MSDFHLKFTQCHGCNGYDRFENMIYDYLNRAFCCEDCKKEYGKGYVTRRKNITIKIPEKHLRRGGKTHDKKTLNSLEGR